MPSVEVRNGESIDSAIRRFKRAWEKSGDPKTLRAKEFHQKASQVRKRERAAARKRLLKKLTREQQSRDNSRDRRKKTIDSSSFNKEEQRSSD